MTKTLLSPKTSGNIKAIESKSEVHRLLIAAALSDKKTEIICEKTNADITATAECLKALGADITYTDGVFAVTPIKDVPENPVLPCNESGSTLRFLLPLVCFFGKGGTFETKGRLSSRPLSPLKEELERCGAVIKTEENRIIISGKTSGTDFTISGNISSQFISGLLFMLTKTGGSINVTGAVESLPYIEMTTDALTLFGCKINFSDGKITVEKNSPLISPEKVKSGGDWSNAAFFITAGVIGKEKITVSGLDINSRQGDKKIIELLRKFGAEIKISETAITAYPSNLQAYSFDASDIPDLVPVLSVAAANAKGVTKITGCKRLRIKESDRIEAVRRLITDLGGKIEIINDDIIITGSHLSGGITDSQNDHRIAMSAAVAAFSCDREITIKGAEAVNKSYPSFWDEIRQGENMLLPYGNNIKLYIEGGSHDEKIEMLLKGFPEGLKIDEEFLSAFMKRRSPGQNEWSTKRKEADKPVFLSGIKDGVTTGEDIHAVIFNSNQHSSDYSDVGIIPRPSHADYPAIMKYGKNVDLRGGGHFSGRLTSLMCIAGALAIQYLRERGISVFAHIYSIGNINDTPFSLTVREEELKDKIPADFPVLSPDKGDKMKEIISEAKNQADSVGGIIECAVTGLPTGLGEHMFGSVEAGISSMIFAVPAVKGIEFGNGFGCARLFGSENNDSYYYDENGVILTKTNNQGGISGGMTNGMPLIFRVAIKPTPSIGKEQDTVNLEAKTNIKYTIKGRHDPCIVPRAVPVIEAATAISILDMMLGKE